MVGERDDGGFGPVGSEERGMNKPIKITSMLVGGSASMGDLTWPVPLGCEVIRDNIPISSHEPRDPAYAGEKLLESSKQLATERVRLGVSAWGPVHGDKMNALSSGPRDNNMGGPTEHSTAVDLKRQPD